MERLLVAVATVLALLGLVRGARAAVEPPEAPPAVAPVRPAPPSGPEAPRVDWLLLNAYTYQPGLARLPATIRALDGTRRSLDGYLLPLYEFDDIREFMLVPHNASCCFGMPVGLNGQVHVRLAAGARGLPNTSEPLRVSGTFRAAERQVGGYVLAIYALDEADVRILPY